MDFFFIVKFICIMILVNFVLNAIFPAPDSKPKVGKCPLHRWRWEEIKDEKGNIVMYRMVCLDCGPLKQPEGPGRLE